MATSTDKKTDSKKTAEDPATTPVAQHRDLAGGSKKDETNPATRMGHSPNQQFGKLTLEHDAAAGTVAFVGADGARIVVDEADFDQMVQAHRNDQTTADQAPANKK